MIIIYIISWFVIGFLLNIVFLLVVDKVYPKQDPEDADITALSITTIILPPIAVIIYILILLIKFSIVVNKKIQYLINKKKET